MGHEIRRAEIVYVNTAVRCPYKVYVNVAFYL